MQEEASPAKSSEGQEANEEEQDLDELDPVALHKKVGCGSEPVGHWAAVDASVDVLQRRGLQRKRGGLLANARPPPHMPTPSLACAYQPRSSRP